MPLWKRTDSLAEKRDAGEENPAIEIEASVCTGERVIGIRNRRTGRLEQTVLVRTQKDVDDYRRAHRPT